MLPKLNLLFSYGVIGRNARFLDVLEGIGKYANIMIDSGAYTNRTMMMKKLKYDRSIEKPITLDEYVGFLQKAHDKVWGYVNLDVIGEPEPTERNHLALLDKGFKPIPVITPGVTAQEVERMLQRSERVSIASSLKTNKQVVAWVYQTSNGKAKVHMLGYSEYPQITEMPICYCDSSSFMSGGRYGSLQYFHKVEGMKIHPVHRRSNKGVIDIESLNELQKNGVTLDDLNNHFAKGEYSALSMVTVNAYVEMHKYLAQRPAYFFSISTFGWLNVILSICVAKDARRAFDFHDARDEYRRLNELKNSSLPKYIEELRLILETRTNHSDVLE